MSRLKAFAYEERREGQRGNEHALIEHVKAEPACKYSVRRVARAAAHDIALRLFESERERREAVGDEVYEQQMRRFDNGEAEKRCGEYREHLREVRTEQELNGLSDIVIYPAPLLDGVDNGREVVIREHHVGDVLRDVRAGYAHAYSDIRALYRRRVVDSVARHGGYLAL